MHRPAFYAYVCVNSRKSVEDDLYYLLLKPIIQLVLYHKSANSILANSEEYDKDFEDLRHVVEQTTEMFSKSYKNIKKFQKVLEV